MKTSLAIAQYYFELSNSADLERISELIHSQATYSSDNTGLYFGKDSIMSMMRQFFAGHSQLQWQIDSIKPLNGHITELHFHCDAVKHNGAIYAFTGVERIVVFNELIRHIEVRT